jgi:hypothetical protein
MLTVILIYLSVSIISFCIILYFIKSAPTGWEDERSFHTGYREFIKVQPKKLSKLRKSAINFSK